jgi:protein involved in polysaccharide export with SLBB domain
MTQRFAQSGRRAIATVLSVGLVLGHVPSRAQGMGDTNTLPSRAELSANTALAGVAASGSAGRLDTNLTVTSIRSDDRDERGQRGGNPFQAPKAGVELKPLPPNEFQRFILESTGKVLPLFGYDFFSEGGSAGEFSAQSKVPVAADYRLGPGDELQIKGWGSIDIDVRTVIDRNGIINLPKVGAINLAGVRSSQAEAAIQAAVGRYYRDFELSVTQGQLRGITVYVVGQARKPGAYQMSGASTLVSALFASGGPNQTGSLRRVQVKRGERVVTTLDLYDFLAKGDKSADVRLQDGDTIVIPAARSYVALTGKVGTPAVYELASEQESIGSLLAVAGGLPVLADPKRAYLERMDPARKPARSVEAFALDAQGLKKGLKGGDVLNVMPLSIEFGNAITLRGNVDQPVRTPWRQGMKVSDLIPSRAFLMSRASVQRQNGVLLSDEERQQAEEGFKQLDARTEGRGKSIKEVRETADTLAQRIGRLVDEVNFEYAVIERIDADKITVQLLPFNLGKALDDPKGSENLSLQAGDVVTVFSVNDVRVPQAKRQVFVRVEGEVLRPGIYQMAPGDGLQALLEKAGGLTSDAYLFGAEFYREEVKRAQTANLDQLVRRLESQVQSRLSSAAASVSATSSESASVAQVRIQAEAQAQKQALDRLRNLKPTGRVMLGMSSDKATPEGLPTLRLESQDRLVVPARPDFVYVLGSVNTENSLLWKKGQKVDHYLAQSGLTSGADLDEMFILRADGSVASRTGAWFGSVKGMEVQPGDVIVLPEKTDHESGWSTFTRNAKDITQIIYQFSLGAAAIKTLRN